MIIILLERAVRLKKQIFFIEKYRGARLVKCMSRANITTWRYYLTTIEMKMSEEPWYPTGWLYLQRMIDILYILQDKSLWWAITQNGCRCDKDDVIGDNATPEIMARQAGARSDWLEQNRRRGKTRKKTPVQNSKTHNRSHLPHPSSLFREHGNWPETHNAKDSFCISDKTSLWADCIMPVLNFDVQEDLGKMDIS